jgi:hypothetical protein
VNIKEQKQYVMINCYSDETGVERNKLRSTNMKRGKYEREIGDLE